MITDRNFSTTTLTVTPSEALEMVRQLADAVNAATRRNNTASFCFSTTVTEKNGAAANYPGVLNVVVNAE